MNKFTLFLVAAVLYVSVAEAQAQYYVPGAYYTIDAEGHESVRVPLRRLRRSLNPYPYPYANGGADAVANANANARAWGDGGAAANANAVANANAYSGGWGLPGGSYGSPNPTLLRPGMSRTQSGPLVGHSVSASTSVGLDSTGNGYYDQTASVN